MLSRLDVNGQAVFRPQTAGVHAVLNQNRDFDFVTHGHSMNLAVAVALTLSPCFNSAASRCSGG